MILMIVFFTSVDSDRGRNLSFSVFFKGRLMSFFRRRKACDVLQYR